MLMKKSFSKSQVDIEVLGLQLKEFLKIHEIRHVENLQNFDLILKRVNERPVYL